VRVSRVQAGPQVVTRSKRLIARDGKRFLILSLQHQGSAIKRQDGREALIKSRQFSISDTSRPFSYEQQSRFCFTSFRFPREELRVRDEDLQALTATAFSSDAGSAAVVGTYFARMAREAAGLDPAVGRHIAATAIDLLALMIDERCGRFSSHAPELAAATLVRVKDHIMRNLSDPDLSPSKIAAAHFMSVRYLHKLFELEGVTVGNWTRMQRLERCRIDILRNAAVGAGIAVVARRWGFVNPSHFSRVFRAAYGMTPREWQVHGLRETTAHH
jgi:AraC-like DNA-binding protein